MIASTWLRPRLTGSVPARRARQTDPERRQPRGRWIAAAVAKLAGAPMSREAMYGRTEQEWQELEQAGWDFLRGKAGACRGDAAHDPTVSYSDANEELAARTGRPAFDFGQQAGRAAMGYLLGRISRN